MRLLEAGNPMGNSTNNQILGTRVGVIACSQLVWSPDLPVSISLLPSTWGLMWSFQMWPCVLFQGTLCNVSGYVPLGHVAEKIYRSKDYIYDLSGDVSALCELHSLPWHLPLSFATPLSSWPVHTSMFSFDKDHAFGRGGGEVKKFTMQRR